MNINSSGPRRSRFRDGMDDDFDLEDLESLLSEHFGITPLPTPAASQDSPDERSDEEEDDEQEEVRVDVDGRARRYMEETHHVGDRDTDERQEGEEGEEAGQLDEGSDRVKIRQFMRDGCGCQMKCEQKLKGKEELIYMHILNTRELEKSDKDMYIMGALVESSDKENTKRGKKRIRSSMTYMYLDLKICKRTFMMVFDIGKHSLQNILKHVSVNGTVPRVHGNSGRKPKNALTYEDIKAAIQFIINYGDTYGFPQPAAPRGRDNDPPTYLPCHTLKKNVHELYAVNCAESQHRVLNIKTFNKVWHHCVGHIKIASPREDVCATCEKLRKVIADAVTEPDKIAASDKFRAHNRDALNEREIYNKSIRRARESRDSEDKYDSYVHYTFDFSQNATIPHHARQMGPLYFITSRKIQIFGFRIDGIPRQLNFLIYEDETIGQDGSGTHGPNAVISMVDWALNTQGCGEMKCAIHADNCPGQNKNQFVLGYLMWRVMTGRHQEIEYLMQIPGHARCYVDGGFALLKQRYRKTDCDTMDHLQEAVDSSSSTNEAVRYPAWTWCDWKTFLSAKFRPVRGVRSFQYFHFSSAEPGILTVRRTGNDDVETKINICKWENVDRDATPETMEPGGLTHQRQAYLFKTVRPYVRPSFQDVTCPLLLTDRDKI